mmetsp:Transcript_18800/g.42900  ORF Transcript_18800/g.42900 Transcript_18800/m.42900 type:complete len:154 (-) Transcript_18800:990-1451(-)
MKNTTAPCPCALLAPCPILYWQSTKGYYFLSLLTGQQLNRLHTTSLPMLDEIIEHIYHIAWNNMENPELLDREQHSFTNDMPEQGVSPAPNCDKIVDTEDPSDIPIVRVRDHHHSDDDNKNLRLLVGRCSGYSVPSGLPYRVYSWSCFYCANT